MPFLLPLNSFRCSVASFSDQTRVRWEGINLQDSQNRSRSVDEFAIPGWHKPVHARHFVCRGDIEVEDSFTREKPIEGRKLNQERLLLRRLETQREHPSRTIRRGSVERGAFLDHLADFLNNFQALGQPLKVGLADRVLFGCPISHGRVRAVFEPLVIICYHHTVVGLCHWFSRRVDNRRSVEKCHRGERDHCPLP